MGPKSFKVVVVEMLDELKKELCNGVYVPADQRDPLSRLGTKFSKVAIAYKFDNQTYKRRLIELAADCIRLSLEVPACSE